MLHCSRFVLFCNERDFMTSLSDDNQADINEKLNSTSTGLRPIYVIFFEFLPISFQMKNNDDMRL